MEREGRERRRRVTFAEKNGEKTTNEERGKKGMEEGKGKQRKGKLIK